MARKIKLSIWLIIGFFCIEGIHAQSEGFKNPFKIGGYISAGGFIYNHDGIAARQPSQGYSLSSAVNISIYGVRVPLFVSINEQGSQFVNPFSRFGFSPQYKWAKIHLGWRNMSFSQFSMQAISFFGGGIELTPGKWRISAMRGRLQKATDGSDNNYFGPRLKRMAWAAKLGYGTRDSYVDFSLFSAKDELNSIELADSIPVNAHENLILGVKGEVAIIKGVLGLFFDGGGSAFTEDLRSDELPEEAQQLVETFSDIYRPNISSHFNYAVEGGLQFSKGIFGMKAMYRKVMPEYRSLGVNYLLNDVEAITVSPSIRLLDNALVMVASIGSQKNNLDKLRQRQNNRLIGSLNIQYNPSAYWGVGTQYSNFSFQQQLVRDTLNRDSIILDQTNHNIVVTPRLTVRRGGYNHSVFVNYNFQSSSNQAMTVGVSNAMHLISSRYSLHKAGGRTKFNIGGNYFNFESGTVALERIGANIGVNQSFLNRKLSLNLTLGYQRDLTKSVASGYASFSTHYNITKELKLSLNSRLRGKRNDGENELESRSEIRIEQRF